MGRKKRKKGRRGISLIGEKSIKASRAETGVRKKREGMKHASGSGKEEDVKTAIRKGQFFFFREEQLRKKSCVETTAIEKKRKKRYPGRRP